MKLLQKHPLWLLSAFVFVGLTLSFGAWTQQTDVKNLPTDTIEIVSHNGLKIPVTVEIAKTPEDKRRGLMHRKKLPKNNGMLFVFQEKQMRAFWMKNTYIPLDLVFIDSEGRIVHIHHDAQPHSLDPISSRFPAQYVLEVNAGMAEEWKIGRGDTVYLPGETTEP